MQYEKYEKDMDFISSAPYYKLTYGVLSNYLPKILKGSFDLILV